MESGTSQTVDIVAFVTLLELCVVVKFVMRLVAAMVSVNPCTVAEVGMGFVSCVLLLEANAVVKFV